MSNNTVRAPRPVSLIPLAAVTFAAGTDNFVIAGLLPAIAASLDVTVAAAGQLVTVYSLVVAVSAPVLSSLTASWRRDHVLRAGLLVFIGANVATALAPTFGWALAGRAVTALGAAMMTPSASALTVALVPERQRGRALALVMGGLMVATALGVPLGLLMGRLDWRHTLWALAGLGLVTLVAVWLSLPAVRVPTAGLRDRLRPLGDPRLVAVAVTSVCVLTASFPLFTYAAPVTGARGTELVVILTAFGVAAVLGNTAAGQLTDHIGGARTMLICVLGLLATLALAPWGLDAGLALLVLAVNGFFGCMVKVPQQARAVAVQPAAAPILLAILSSAVFLGFACAGAFGAVVLQTAGPHVLPWLSALVLLVPLALLLASPDVRRAG